MVPATRLPSFEFWSLCALASEASQDLRQTAIANNTLDIITPGRTMS